ncbi:MAG: glucuronate isomerase [Acidobacteriota bacterium]|nr:glucuronate isomerase [Acidobacteriota bacterium]
MPRPPLALDPDRLLPASPEVRAVARGLYDAVRELPILSPHGHVDPTLLLEDRPFPDPASLFIAPDHYVTRLLHADGVDLGELGVGRAATLTEAEARRAWWHLCSRWHLFRGTPVRTWLEHELVTIFDVDVRPSAATADHVYDHVAQRLARDDFRPRALCQRFGIDVLTITADPADDLAAFEGLDRDPTWTGRVVPSFRPDRYLEPASPAWAAAVGELAEAAGRDIGDYSAFVEALEERRRYFIDHGATSADHSHIDVGSEPLSPADASRIFEDCLGGSATAADALAFRRHMLSEMARMSCDDGLVMTLHPGVRRSHHPPTEARFGPDTGHDLPVRVEFTDALRPLLSRYGTHPGFHLVLFTLDETTWSRELAPLAGFYPSVFIGVPWWFLDAPEAIRRFRAAVTETAGFYRTSGFVDDTRAFCSIPARHDMARRIDAGVLAEMVAEHRLDEDEARQTAEDLVSTLPRQVFKL